MVKQKLTVKRKSKAKTTKRVSGSEDTKQRRKHSRGGRIEAYTFGETLGDKDWP